MCLLSDGNYSHPLDLGCPASTLSGALQGWGLYLGFFVLNYIVLSTQTVRKNILYYFLYLILLPFIIPILLVISSLLL